MITLKTHEIIDVPTDVVVCRVCGASLVIEDCDEWEESDDDGYLIPLHIAIECTTAPEAIGTYEWWDWLNGHWSTPYADWLPVSEIVLEWFRKHYRYTR